MFDSLISAGGPFHEAHLVKFSILTVDEVEILFLPFDKESEIRLRKKTISSLLHREK